jgi:hypothetical protein
LGVKALYESGVDDALYILTKERKNDTSSSRKKTKIINKISIFGF